jgi:hypothetical protein
VIPGLKRALAAAGINPRRGIALLIWDRDALRGRLWAVRAKAEDAAETHRRAYLMGCQVKTVKTWPLIKDGEFEEVTASAQQA